MLNRREKCSGQEEEKTCNVSGGSSIESRRSRWCGSQIVHICRPRSSLDESPQVIAIDRKRESSEHGFVVCVFGS